MFTSFCFSSKHFKSFWLLVARLKIGDLCFWVRWLVSLFVSLFVTRSLKMSNKRVLIKKSPFYKNFIRTYKLFIYKQKALPQKIFWIFILVNISTLEDFFDFFFQSFFFRFFFVEKIWTKNFWKKKITPNI